MTQTFHHYLAVVEVGNAELDAIEVDLADWCARPPFAWQVARLAAYRGVTRLGALTLAAESPRGAGSPTPASSWGSAGSSQASTPAATPSTAVGLPRPATPTCAGNWPGSAWSYQHRPSVGREIAQRHQGLDPEVVARAWAAQQRLCGRFRALAAPKNTNSIVAAAIARELAGFLWAEMTA
jgi:transposase